MDKAVQRGLRLALIASLGALSSVTAAEPSLADRTAASSRIEQAPTIALEPEQRDPFAQGSWSFQSYGSASLASDDGEVYLGHVGFGYYFVDGHSINLELAAGAIDGDRGAADGSVAAIELMIRSHWIRFERWTIFAEAGAGILLAEHPFPQGGTHQNFTPQAGVGVSLELEDHLHLIGGARWHHISNANKEGSERNPGYNSAMLYTGLMWTF